MRLKALLTIAALTLGAGASAARTIDVTYSGTIRSGQDSRDYFGTGRTDLGGLGYVAHFVYDTALGLRHADGTSVGQIVGGNLFGATSPLVSMVVTIGSVTRSFASSLMGMVTLQDSRTVWGDPQGSYQFQAWGLSDSYDPLTNLRTSSSLFDGGFDYGAGPFGFDLDRPPVLGNPKGEVSGGLEFLVQNLVTGEPLQDVSLTLLAGSMAISAGLTPSPVPLPATGGLALLALGGLGCLRLTRGRAVDRGGAACRA